MARKGRTTEEIIAALREAEVRIGQGETVGKICRSLGYLSGLAELPSAVASRLGTWDTAKLEALKDRAGQLAGQLTERASAVMRSRS